jgi:quercetin dioxygenase-like cupin family protein
MDKTKMDETNIVRKPLLSAPLGKKQVTSVDVREIVFEPEQKTGRHQHPCPVFGFVAEGMALLEIEGKPPQMLPRGSAFHEPANTVIARFDNASATERLKFIACYLLEGQQELIEMLPE